MNEIHCRDYIVWIGSSQTGPNDLLDPEKYTSCFLLADENTERDCLPVLLKILPGLEKIKFIRIPSGEMHKNLETCSEIWNELFLERADRKALLINLGGGVITDMGAFSASTYKRGIRFFQIPTTLLSMVDASVGGKTGIDFKGAKNMLGTFNLPIGVWILPEFLATLPESELKSGFSEIVKHALIQDEFFFQELENALSNEFPFLLNGPGKLGTWENWIQKSVEIKNAIVQQDPKEMGIRKLLNFGHTIGHALESYFLESSSPLNHGQAIAIGMICETYISLERNNQGSALYHRIQVDFERIKRVLKPLYPKVYIPEQDFPAIYSLMENDKKNESGQINFTLLNGIGKGIFDQQSSQETIFNSFRYFNKILDNS